MTKFTRPKIYLLTLVLIVAALLITACGGDDEEPTATPESSVETQAEATVAPSPTTAEAAAPADTPVPPPPPAERVPPPDVIDSGPAADLAPDARDGMYDAPPEMTIDPSKFYYATLKTDRGDIRLQLFADRAPETVNNFVYLAREGFYDNTIFHRVLEDFMAQAGDPLGTGTGGPGYDFQDEIYPGLVFDRAGLLAMANRGPGTNGSQFFITFAPTDWLNGLHTIFGEVLEGDDVLAQLTLRDPLADPDFAGDTIYTIEIEESDTSELPVPTPAPPTATPTQTPTPYAPTSLDDGERSLAQVPAAERANYFNTAPEMVIDAAQAYVATITTDKGDVVVDLYADKAPVAVNNFVVLAELGFYDGLPINLVRPDDSIVLGAPDNDPGNDVGYQFEAEVGSDIQTDVGSLTYIPFGVTADGQPLSSGSQLIFALAKPPETANERFSFFGQIVDGLDVVEQLETADIIQSVTISTE